MSCRLASKSTLRKLSETCCLLVVFLTLLAGCGKARKIPGIENFKASVISERLYVSFISTQLQWDAGLTVPIPGLKDSTIAIAPDLGSSGTVLQIAVGIRSLLNDVIAPHEMSALPDGRALPDVKNGMLPRWDVDIQNLQLSIYLSEDAFGLFVPLKLVTKRGGALNFTISAAITDEKGNLLGKAYAIPASSMNSSQAGSGLFILIPFVNGQLLTEARITQM